MIFGLVLFFLISISANVYLWYYSPILPAIAVLATKFIRKGSKLDYLLVSFLLVYSLFVSFYVVKGIKTTNINPTSHYGGEEEVKAAELLANKSNVLLLFIHRLLFIITLFIQNIL